MTRSQTGRALRLLTVLALVATAFGFVATRARTAPAIVSTDAGAWLLNTSVGTATHVNGLSGVPDAEVSLTNGQSTALHIDRQGAAPLVVDQSAGRLGLIDPKRQSFAFSGAVAAGNVVWAGGQGIYSAAPGQPEVTRIDAASLQPAQRFPLPGSAAQLASGSAAVDSAGTLWVLDQADGTVLPVSAAGVARSVRVAGPGDVLAVSAVNGGAQVLVTDSTREKLTEIAGSRVRAALRVVLPGDNGPLTPGATTALTTVPLLHTDGPACDLLLVDIPAGTTDRVRLRESGSCDGLSAPVANAGKVYVPDAATGSLVVCDVAGRALGAAVPVATGPAGLDVFVYDGQVWANDPAGPDAVVVAPDGVHRIVKYRPPPPPSQAASGSGPSGSSTGTGTASAPTSATPATPTNSAASKPVPTPTGSRSAVRPGPTRLPTTPNISSVISRIPLPSRLPHPSGTSTPTPPKPPPSGPSTSVGGTSGSSTPATHTPTSSPSRDPGSLTLSAAPGPGYVELTLHPSAGFGPAVFSIGGPDAGNGVTIIPRGPLEFRAITPVCKTTFYTFAAIARLPDGTQITSDPAEAFGCVPPGPVAQLALSGGAGYLDVAWRGPEEPGTGTGTDQLLYLLVWVYDNSGSGGPTGSVIVSPDQADPSGKFAYHIPAPLGTHVVLGIEAVNGSGSGTLLTPEGVAWDLAKCASPAGTCSYNHTEALPLDASPGGQATGTVVPGSAADAFGPAVTVLCQTTGPTVTLPGLEWAPSSVWDEVTYHGRTGYLSDLMVSTANSMVIIPTPGYGSC